MLANRLKPYGIESKQMKLSGANRRGYERADFEDAWKRHVDPLPGNGATGATPATHLGNKDKKIAEVAEVAPWDTEDAIHDAAEPGSFDPDFDGLRDMPEGLRRQRGAP